MYLVMSEDITQAQIDEALAGTAARYALVHTLVAEAVGMLRAELDHQYGLRRDWGDPHGYATAAISATEHTWHALASEAERVQDSLARIYGEDPVKRGELQAAARENLAQYFTQFSR